jgi:acyl-CoA dehydrogenase
MTLAEREAGRTNTRCGGSRPTELLRNCEGDGGTATSCKPSGASATTAGDEQPGAGSDVQSMTTRAVRDGDDYVIDGTKHFISPPTSRTS